MHDSSVTFPNIEGIRLTTQENSRINVWADAPSAASIQKLLEWLPVKWKLGFYDKFYPSMTDPGAYVSVLRKEEVFIYKLGNHGWSSDWLKQSRELIAAWMHMNLHCDGSTSYTIEDAIFQIDQDKNLQRLFSF